MDTLLTPRTPLKLTSFFWQISGVLGRTSKIIVPALLIACVLTVAFAPMASADEEYTLESVSGIWISVSGGSNVSGVGTNVVRWGLPASDQKSGYRFDGASSQTFGPGQKFLLGVFTHFNWPIYHGSAADGATLRITLHFTDPPISPDPTFTYYFDHEETPNVPGSCPSWQQSSTPCDDKVTFPSAYGEDSFKIGDKLYTLKILGFQDGWPTGSPVDEFITEEYKDNVAYLVGELSSVLVPEPQITLVAKETSPDGTTWYDADEAPGPNIPVGSPVYWHYIVQNTGNVTMTNVTVTDNRGVSVSCPKTSLDLGESMTCTATGTAVAGQYENVGSVRGEYNGTTYDGGSDRSHYFGVEPDCSNYNIEFLGSDYNGNNTTFTYKVSALDDPAISHWVLGLPTCVEESDIVSAVPGNWEFGVDPTTSVRGIKYETSVEPGPPVIFTLTLSGYRPEGAVETAVKAGQKICHDSTTGPACPQPGIHIEKSTNGEDADSAPGPYVEVGDSVTWTYVVTNTGDVPLSNINVTDNQGVMPVYQDGDTNHDNKLDTGETWTRSEEHTSELQSH